MLFYKMNEVLQPLDKQQTFCYNMYTINFLEGMEMVNVWFGIIVNIANIAGNAADVDVSVSHEGKGVKK